MATISEELQEALKDNSKWLEQVKMSLTIAAQLYASFQEVEKDYKDNLAKCEEQANKCTDTYQELEKQKEAFNQHLAELESKALEFGKHMESLKDKVEEWHGDSEYLAHEMEVYFTEMENFRIKTLDLKDYLKTEEEKNKNAFNAYKDYVKDASEKLNQVLEDAQNLKELNTNLRQEADAKYKEFTDEKDKALNTLDTNKNNALSEVDTKKSEALEAIENKKTDSLSEVDTKKEDALNAINLIKSEVDNLNLAKMSDLESLRVKNEETMENLKQNRAALDIKTKVLSQDLSFSVGEGCDFNTLEEALKESGKYVTNTGSSITFRIKDGYTQNQPLNIVNQSVRLFFKSEKDGVKGNINVNINDRNRQAFFLQQGSYVVFQDLNLNCGTSVCNQLICSFNSFVETVDCNLNAYAVVNVGLSYNSVGIFTRTNFNNTYQDGYRELSVGTGSSASVNDYTKFIANNPKMTAIFCFTAFVNCHFAANSVSAGGITGNYGWGAAVFEGGIIDLIGYDQSLPMTGRFTWGRTNIACNQWTRNGAIAY